MILRQDCARVISNPGAHKSLNLGKRARMRQDRQDLITYCVRERKIQNLFLSLGNNKSNNPGDPGTISIYGGDCISTLAQPWRNPGADPSLPPREEK